MTFEQLKQAFGGTKYPSLGYSDAEIQALKEAQEAQIEQEKLKATLMAAMQSTHNASSPIGSQLLSRRSEFEREISRCSEAFARQMERYLRERVIESGDDPAYHHLSPEDFVRRQSPILFEIPHSRDRYVRVPDGSPVLNLLGIILRLPQIVKRVRCKFQSVARHDDAITGDEVLDLTFRITANDRGAPRPVGLQQLYNSIKEQMIDSPEFNPPEAVPLPTSKDALKEFLAKEDEL